MKKIYRIKGLHCGSCVKKVTAALEALGARACVTLDPPQAVIEGDVANDVDALNAALARTGAYRLISVPEVAPEATQKNWLGTYYPLLLIVSLIAIASFAGIESLHGWMLNFMAGFFIVFGGFKLLNLKGFRDAYAAYDLLAARWKNYGLIYPFLELALGFAFLFRFQLTAALWLSLLLTGFGGLGVWKALREKKSLRCACLGTALNLPMSTLTLVEDLGMAAMAVVMLANI
jgi:copper chaperone CopZ